ncbi:MAG TPA: hypothetical protein VHL85_08570 [Burkholderiales bacterium]|jgi:hypothetical protein|nr:hypothetical protein [Burkholderiales bacterium]
MRGGLMAVLLAISAAAFAQSDIGLVNLVTGNVTLAPQSGAAVPVKAFMKVREGDRFDVPAGAQVRVVFFEGARQERWHGPASFRAGRLQSAPVSGKPAEITALPASVPLRMARVPELMQNAKLGGIQVRSAQALKPVQEHALEEARTTYDRLRKELPGDDITPELFYYSALNEYQLYEDMAPVVDEMLRKQPDNEDVKSLAGWLKGRRRR